MRRQELADACNQAIAARRQAIATREGRSDGAAKWAGMTAATIGSLERGEVRWPNEEYRAALCTVLGMSETALGLYVDRPERTTPATVYLIAKAGPQADPSSSSGALLTDIDWLRQRTAPLNDPDVEQHLAAALADARRYLDGSVVDYFRQRLERSKTHDGDLGPTRTLPVVLGTLAAIRQHAREVKSDVRDGLLALGADGAEFAGWLYRDLLDTPNAVYWYDRAMEWAQEAGDTTMQAYVLLKKSQMAYDLHDGYRVMTFADAAQRDSGRLPLKVRAEVTQQAALGMAMAGEPLSDVERTIDHARELLSTALSGDDYDGPASAHFTADTLVLRQAACYAVAGKPAKAATLFADVIAGGALSRRDTGFFQARWAVALALSGEPDEAAAVGLDAIGRASQTDSERTKRVGECRADADTVAFQARTSGVARGDGYASVTIHSVTARTTDACHSWLCGSR